MVMAQDSRRSEEQPGSQPPFQLVGLEQTRSEGCLPALLETAVQC